MASTSLVLPSISLKTLILTKTINPNLSFPSSIVSLKSSPPTFNKAISVSSSSRFGTLSSRFVTKVAVGSEYEQEEVDDERNFSPDLKIFVGNLPFNVDSAELADLFADAGGVEQVEVIYDKVSGRSRGFAFVTMSTVDDVRAAVEQFNGYELAGRELRVNSGPPPPRDDFASRAPRSGGYSDSPRSGGYSDSPRSGGGYSDSGNRLYVGNLSWGVDDLSLQNFFNQQGEVTEARVIYERESGRSKGFGFVSFSSAEEANRAVDTLNGAELDGRALRVSIAEARPPRRF